jgi:hypothetical protein
MHRCARLLLPLLALSVAPVPGWGQSGPPTVESERRVVLRVEAVAGPPRIVRAVKGERIHLAVEANRPIVLHIHGLGIEIMAAPDRPGEASIIAKATGRFPVHVHDTQDPRGLTAHHHRAPFAYLEVYPK